MTALSRYYSLEYKQRVVEYYYTHRPRPSLAAVARTFHIKGGSKTVCSWIHRRAELETRPRQGRPTALSRVEIGRYVKKPIRENNRKHEPNFYSNILSDIHTKIHKNISIRTLQRYGKQRSGIKKKKALRRTADECNYTHIE